jgi:hypothetical protein
MSLSQPARVGRSFDEMRVAKAIRHVAMIGIAAVVTGVLIGGIGGRVFMRLSAVIAPDRATGAITENGAVVGDITFGGTVALIIFIGVFSGVFGGVVYTISEPWLSWAGPLRGVVFGVFLLATASLAVFDPNNLDFVILGNDPRNVIMLGVLFLAFGPVLVSLVPALDKRLPGVNEQKPIDSIPGYIALVVGGFLALALVLANLFLEGVCECDPPRLMGLFVVGMALSTAAWWRSRVKTPRQAYPRSLSAFGYLCTGGAFVAGTFRAVSNIAQLL